LIVYQKLKSSIADVRYWPLADIGENAFNVAFGGKADMTLCGNPLSRSLLGVKRTSLFAAQLSAFEPKRLIAFGLIFDQFFY
jgi:hypothetical protein